jgi:nucleoside-diphosphate-sugar epimerase
MILVTGATGFLGAELVVQLLQTEDSIRCIKRKSSKIPESLVPFNKKIEWVEADLLDIADLEQAFDGIETVFHCAAQVSINPKNAKETIHVNTEGTSNVVNLCLLYAIKQLVHVSSIAALGNAKSNELITEEHYWDAFDIHNSYAISKYLSEMEVWRGIEEGLTAVIVNPSVIIGEASGYSGSGMLFKTIKNGLKFYTSGSIGLVHVYDVARCMIMLQKKSDGKNQRYIINAENYSYKQLFTQVADAFGMKVPNKEAKPWMLEIAWRLQAIKNAVTGKQGGLNKDIARSAFTKQEYANQKIVNTLNYNFKSVKTSIKQIAKALDK